MMEVSTVKVRFKKIIIPGLFSSAGIVAFRAQSGVQKKSQISDCSDRLKGLGDVGGFVGLEVSVTGRVKNSLPVLRTFETSGQRPLKGRHFYMGGSELNIVGINQVVYLQVIGLIVHVDS